MRKQGGKKKEKQLERWAEGTTEVQMRDCAEFVRMQEATLLESEASKVNCLKIFLALLLFVKFVILEKHKRKMTTQTAALL